MNFLNKISLGTVQFGIDYGIANVNGKVDKGEVFKILKCAGLHKIDFLDTAYSYGESEKVLGEFIQENTFQFNITSKIPPLGQGFSGKVEEVFLKSLEDLKVNNVYGCLIHKFEDYLSNKELWDQLKGLKAKGMIKKIGFSLYNTEELETLFLQNVKFDIIQLPYSVFDRRFAGYFEALKSKNIEVHVRSIFLQGLAFLNLQDLPVNLRKAKECLLRLRSIAADNNLSINAICLNFVLLNPYVDKVIMGVDGLDHFKNNLRDIQWVEKIGGIMNSLDALRIDDEDILLPYRWAGAKA